MSDPIDSIKRSNALTGIGRITPTKRAGMVKREHEEDFVFEDRLDVAPGEHLSNAPDQIDLSLEMVRALIAGELPEEAVTALQSFAPIGDLTDGLDNCDRVQSKGMDFITWRKNQSLTEALAYEAV